MSTEGAVLDFIKSAYESNKPAVLAAITAAEGGVEGFIVQAIKDAPKPGGALGVLFGYLEPQLETYVTGLVTSAGPTIVYTFIDQELADAAKAAGG